MVYQVVVDEIKTLLVERGLPHIDIQQGTPLEAFGFDSVTYTILVTRIEERLSSAAFDSDADLSLPVVVADLVRLFEDLPSDAENHRTPEPQKPV